MGIRSELATGYDIGFLGLSQTEQFVRLDYTIPLGGVVELHLFDQSGTRVWYNTYASKEGQHAIRMKRSGFRPNQTYRFQLKYKMSEYAGEIHM